jgi:nitroreductase
LKFEIFIGGSMDFLELVKKRQSVRKYLDKPIPREIIEYCLEAARLAPSACNAQPWTFVVVDGQKAKRRFVDKVFLGEYSENDFVKKAAVIIVVVSEQSDFLSAVGQYFKDARDYLIDIGIACEHLVLAATEKGLGACWIGWFDQKSAKEILGIPEDKKIDVMISLGYPKDDTAREKVRKKIDKVRKFDKYSS